jgi:flagellar protein FliT
MTHESDRENRIVACYESMSHVTGKMLAAARESDWDSVVLAGKECSLIIDELKQLGDLAPRDSQLRQRKREIIRKVLADDAEIRNLAQPWLCKLEGYLKSAGPSKKPGNSYGNASAFGE